MGTSSLPSFPEMYLDSSPLDFPERQMKERENRKHAMLKERTQKNRNHIYMGYRK